jgi:hypothetical protein
MRAGTIGLRLAASTIALLPLALPANAAGLRASRSCSLADAHAALPAVEPDVASTSSETAIAVEALRPLPAVATSSAAPPVTPEQSPDYPSRSAPQDFLVPAETARDFAAGPPEPLQAVERSAAVDASGPPQDAPLAFRDYRAPKERFRAWRELRLLRLWDDARVSVWFGLDKKGHPGLHFRQRNPGEEIPLARATPYGEAPPLRSVPLTSP